MIKKYDSKTRHVEDCRYKIGKNPINKLCLHQTNIDGVHGKYHLGGSGPHEIRATYLNPKYTYNDIEGKYYHDLPEDMFLTEFESIEDFDESRIYYADWGNYLIFDNNKELIPLVIRADYIGSVFNNERMELEKALPYIKASPLFINTDDLGIEDIPYYNSEPYCNRCLSVEIVLDKKTYNDLYQKALGHKRHWSLVLKESILNHWNITKENDVLGLYQFLKRNRH